MNKILLLFLAVMSIFSCTPQESPDTFTDSRDGHVYKTVTIGSQVWMAENLAYLPEISPASYSYTEPYYYINGYNGTSLGEAVLTDNYRTYGVLYNWSAAMNGAASSEDNPSDVQGICPTGWHLPSDAEWKQLTDYLGGEDVAGKLKEAGTSNWISPNTGATNESGFTALPGGFRRPGGLFFLFEFAVFWSSTEDRSTHAWARFLCSSDNNVDKSCFSKDYGFSVRCLQDSE
ncbi:MAG: FISUMP domain-containing protein [Bacteroidales bacterium]|jgi:uncharacterized protein (TIGR02145 family)|nr:FISUMP domain-containing protein [Bacteroidales bacterium]MDD4501352.1 FISUMP domain-containing protein [Bacteroidales bacterium]